MIRDLLADDESAHPNRSARKLGRLLIACYCTAFILVISALALTCLSGTSSRPVEVSTVVKQSEETARLLTKLRAPLNEGQNAVRDFLLSLQSDRLSVFDRRMSSARVDAEEALRRLQGQTSVYSEALSRLRLGFDTYWTTLERPRTWTERERGDRALTFIPQELQPSRRQVARVLDGTIEQARDAARDIETAWERRREALIAANTAVLTTLAIVVLAGGVLTYWYFRESAKERLRKYEQVIGAKADLEQLSARLIAIQENERKRLSRELHDGIGQTLTALRMEISHLLSLSQTDCMEIPKRLERARTLAEETMRTVRDISLLLRPTLLDDLGLEPALRWQAEDFAARTNVRCMFRSSDLPDDLPEAMKTCVYRVVQESLNNCQKHAAPTKVSITIERGEAVLNAVIEDDGYGFEMNGNGMPARSVGLGILGMKERAAMLGGKLSIQSAPGRGTKVTLSLAIDDVVASEKSTVVGQALHADTHTAG